MHDRGDYIVICTSRDINLKQATEFQLEDWGVPYDELHFNQIPADIYVNDRSITPEIYLRYNMVRDDK